MDSSAPTIFAKGTLITSATCACLAGVYGTYKGQHSGILAGSTAISSGLASTTFFGFREYVISPILVSTLPWKQYARRRREIAQKNGDLEGQHIREPLTWSEMRTHKLLDSGISGAAAGGIWNTWKRGRPGIIPGITTGALLCAALQLAFNEFSVARVKYVSQKLRDPSYVPPSAPLAPAFSPPSPFQVPDQPPVETPNSLLQGIITSLGFARVSDKEYVAKLKKTKEGYLKRIEILEQEVEAEKGKRS